MRRGVKFEGAVASTGLAVLVAALFAEPSRSFRGMALLAGPAGFGAAIGIHFVVRYLDPVHLAPAFLGAAVLAAGWSSRRP